MTTYHKMLEQKYVNNIDNYSWEIIEKGCALFPVSLNTHTYIQIYYFKSPPHVTVIREVL